MRYRPMMGVALLLLSIVAMADIARAAGGGGGGHGGGGGTGGGGHAGVGGSAGSGHAGGGFGGFGGGGFGGYGGSGFGGFGGHRGGLRLHPNAYGLGRWIGRSYRQPGGGGPNGGYGFGQNGDALSDYAPYGRPIDGCDPTTPSRAHPGCE